MLVALLLGGSLSALGQIGSIAAQGYVCTPTLFRSQDELPAELRTEVASDAIRVAAGTTTGDPNNPASAPGDGTAAAPKPNPAAVRSTPIARPTLPAGPFQWKHALRQYAFFTLVMHSWRFAHETGTRDATGNGPWLHDWFNSVSETRGWDDGDGWHASFVGHPMTGAIYGFMEQDNDPKYRKLEWGDGRIYWMSRLRALAFSSVASTQWTLGPVSEGSLGNVQTHASPGFIDLVNTPGLGVLTMMGEDMLDRYVIVHLENHTSNPWILLVGRSFVNPSRSFANLMDFRPGWYRATRPGLFGKNHEWRKELIRQYKAGLISAPFGPHTADERAMMNQDEAGKKRPQEAPIEIQSYAYYESFLGGGSCVGAGGQGAARLNPNWQFVAEVGGCMILNKPKYQSGDSEMFAVGPRWTPRAAKKFSPFAEVMFGGRRVTHEIVDPTQRTNLLAEWDAGQLPHYPKRSDYSVENQAFGFAMTAGGGFDAVFGRAFAWRVLDVQYAHSWLPTVDSIQAQDGVEIRSGVTLRVGTW